MDTRAEAFTRKFSSAQPFLGSKAIQDIVSFKFRDNGSYSRYDELLTLLQENQHLHVEQIQGDFQGKAWLLTDDDGGRAIVVEHETGLEILYIAGSIASLISLIPMITSFWQRVTGASGTSGRPYDRPYPFFRGFEKRVFNAKNELVEDSGSIIEGYLLRETLRGYIAVERRIEKIEQRLAILEKREGRPKKPIRKSKTAKKSRALTG